MSLNFICFSSFLVFCTRPACRTFSACVRASAASASSILPAAFHGPIFHITRSVRQSKPKHTAPKALPYKQLYGRTFEFCLSYATRFSNTSDRFVVTSDAFSRQSHHDYENLIDVMEPALFDGGGTMRFDSTTQEETDFLWEMTKHLYLYEDSNLLRVISEESKAYFAGDISAQEAAERIQNRASLVLGE
jgi:hypothetical protein